jgi:hypothetical protein
MGLRSAHLPYDHTEAAQHQFDNPQCIQCGAWIRTFDEQLTQQELRWRHIHHRLLVCPRPAYPALQPAQIKQDLVSQALEAKCTTLAQELNTLFNGPLADLTFVHDRVAPLLLDPLAFCSKLLAPRSLGFRIQCLLAAQYILAGSVLAERDFDAAHLSSLQLPQNTHTFSHTFPADDALDSPKYGILPASLSCSTNLSDNYCAVLHPHDSGSESPDELPVPWEVPSHAACNVSGSLCELLEADAAG